LIEYISLMERLSNERQRALLQEANNERLLRSIDPRTSRISYQMLASLGKRMERWGAGLVTRYSSAPKKSPSS